MTAIEGLKEPGFKSLTGEEDEVEAFKVRARVLLGVVAVVLAILLVVSKIGSR